jgi:hypothetical protein
MAAIFQIRRGTSNVSLTDGELYLHQGSGSLQFGSGSSQYTMLALNTPVKGDINLIGNISASGDVRIGGNIYLGDSPASDNISALGIFTTNLVPNGTIDLGTTSAKWNNVYGNAVWGAISASNGVVSGSAQFTGVLSSLNSYTQSQDTKNSTLQTYTASIDTKFTTLQSLTASNLNRLSRIEESTASLNLFTASVNGHIVDINIKTGSIESKNTIIAAYTSSMNIFTASVNGHIADINTKTGSFETKWSTLQNVTSSILSYTSSLKSAIELTGSSVTILGNLVVKGTQLLVDSTTIQLGDNILELNGTAAANGGLLVKDTTGTSGSLLWDSTNDYWKGGTIGNEEKLLRAGSDGVISGSLSSLNTYTASADNKFSAIQASTASLNTHSASIDNKFNAVQASTSSLNTFTASALTRFTRIEESTSSLNAYTASQDTKNSTLANYTASVSGHISDINTKTGSFETKWSTLQTYTASIDTKFSTLQTYTASIDTKFLTLQTLTASMAAQVLRIQESTASLNTFSASMNAFYNQFTASTVGFSASVDSRLDAVEYTVTVLDPGNIGGALLGLNLATQSLQNYTASANARFNRIEESTSSLNSFSASNGNTSLNTFTSSLNAAITASGTNVTINGDLTVKGTNTFINSTTLQIGDNIIELNGTSVANGGLLIKDPTGGSTISGSLLWDSTNDYWKGGTIGNEVKFLRAGGDGVISGSGQISAIFEEKASATHTLVSGSSQVTDILISLNTYSASVDTKFTTLQTLTASMQSQVLRLQESTASLNLYTASIDTKFTTLQSLTASNLNRLSRIEESTASLNLFTQSLSTTYEGRATATKTIFSGSSQVNFTQLNSISPNIVSGSTNSTNVNFTTSGGSITANLIGGVVSGSSQVNFTQLSGISNGIVSGSSQVTPLLPTGVVSGSIQLLGSTTIHSGSANNYQFNSIGVGTTPSNTTGEIRATGDITAYYSSDIRLKENIKPIENALIKVESISGNTYDWKEGFEMIHSHKGNDVGVIAQEIENVLPQIVIERDNGYKAVDYEKIVPLLIQAIKELSAKVKELENK